MTAPSDPIDAGAVLPLLPQTRELDAWRAAGSPYEYLPECVSTNAVLRQMADGAPTGTVVVTDDQTGGRGRSGRGWLSRPGLDLTFSVLLRPGLGAAQAHLLALATGVGVAEVLEAEYHLAGRVALKWPNDVLLAGRKVCGILLEGSLQAEGPAWAVAGVGLNVNSDPGRMLASLPAEQAAEWRGRPQPVSLGEDLGRALTRAPLLAALLARLMSRWAALEEPGGIPALLADWSTRDALAGRTVQVLTGPERCEPLLQGVAAGIGEEGQLLVRVPVEDGGRQGLVQEVFVGDVSVAVADGTGRPERP